MGTWLMPKGVGCALGRLSALGSVAGAGPGARLRTPWIDSEDLRLLAAPLLLREEVVHGARLLHPV